MQMYMIFRYENDEISRFGTVITELAFFNLIQNNQPPETRLVEEKVTFPQQFLGGGTRPALIHYLSGEKFACYVPVFPTEQEIDDYLTAHGR